MIRLNDTSAIIFDLRDNRGGHPEMAKQIAAWLFERPVGWYNPDERSAGQSMTHSPVRNSRLVSKPVYILTSSRTVDGDEQFVYNLKMLKRVTVIGERTRVEATSRPSYQNDDHLGTPMKPLTKSCNRADCKGAGVAPDVKVKASDALRVAEESALTKVEMK
jgi:C-terminal processing protease CtpA/Prc